MWTKLITAIVKWLWPLGPATMAIPQPPKLKPEDIELKPKYIWSNKTDACRAVRVICDEMGMAVWEKNEIASTIHAESNFNPRAYHLNKNGSFDAGIVQANSEYWIGPGKLFPSIEYVYENPEECVRWMCKEWRKHKNWWIAYKNLSYKNYPSKV